MACDYSKTTRLASPVWRADVAGARHSRCIHAAALPELTLAEMLFHRASTVHWWLQAA